PTHFPTLSLHDALPISLPDLWNQTSGQLLIGASLAMAHMKAMSSRATAVAAMFECLPRAVSAGIACTGGAELSTRCPEWAWGARSEEHTSELQSRFDLV